MRALTKLEAGPGHIGLVERPDPSPAAGQVLVELHGTGVCGTDLHIQAGDYPTEPPVTMGHEVSGVVVDVGPGADGAWRGRRIVAETYHSTCGTCDRCRDGRPNLCAARRSIGSHADGGFAPRLVLPETNLHAVPDWLGAHAAALAEPLACVCNCLLDPPVVQPGDHVVVTGPGTIGLLAAQVARAQGGSVLVCGLPQDADRLAEAGKLGFEVTDGRPAAGTADVVVECSGSAGGAALCLETVRRAGRFVQIGVYGDAVTIPLDHLVYGELIATSGFASTPRSWKHAMRLIGSKAVDLASLVTGVAPLDAWQDVFADLREGRGLKIVFDPRL
jgi:L-iditol 2-dehydrogenase